MGKKKRGIVVHVFEHFTTKYVIFYFKTIEGQNIKKKKKRMNEVT